MKATNPKVRPFDVDEGRLERGVEVGAGAGGRDAGRLELVERLEEAGRAAVEEVVRGKGRDVDAVRVAQPRQDRRIDAEDHAVVDGEVVDDRALEVVEGDVGAADQLGDGALVAGPARHRRC